MCFVRFKGGQSNGKVLELKKNESLQVSSGWRRLAWDLEVCVLNKSGVFYGIFLGGAYWAFAG